MKDIWRIGLSVGLAIIAAHSTAEAQTQPAAGAASQPRAATARTGGGAMTSSPAGSVNRRTTAATYNRLTSSYRRGSAESAPRSTPAAADTGPYADDDPFRPYSAQARQSASAVSPTRLSEGPPPPPQVAPPSRYNYYANMRSGQYYNANVPQVRHHTCLPSRDRVLSRGPGYGR